MAECLVRIQMALDPMLEKENKTSRINPPILELLPEFFEIHPLKVFLSVLLAGVSCTLFLPLYVSVCLR